MKKTNTIVSMENITKVFGTNKVLDNVNFNLKEGEVHALLGENGAGKTTLMNILFGLHAPTDGELYIREEKILNMNPKKASELRIGMVHQHFMLIPKFTVMENIMLGDEITKAGGVLDRKKAREEILRLSTEYGLEINPDLKVQDISVGMQQRVEILKALSKGVDILIFDEPTAVLTPQEILDFENIIKHLIGMGKSVIIITHKLKEIMDMADRVTIIRRGKFIGEVNVSETNEMALAEMMVGRDVSFTVQKKDKDPGEKVLEIRDLVVEDSRNLEAVRGLNLDVYQGEILGIAGVDGNGQSELIQALTGLRESKSGEFYLNGEDLTNATPREIIDSGMCSIPEDRQHRGLVLDFSIADNLILENVRKDQFSKHSFLKFDEIKKFSEKLVKDFDIRPPVISQKARSLSGGNQQKVIIAREITNNPDLLIAAQPTRGLDVGAIEFIHDYLIDHRDRNKAVLLISYELDEIMDLSDRIAVIHEGQIVGIVDPKEVTEMEIGHMMAGGVAHE